MYYKPKRKHKNKYADPMRKFWDNIKSLKYAHKKGFDKVLDSGFTVKQTIGGLQKAWLGYKIAKNKGEFDKMEYYARIIQKAERELGRPITQFDILAFQLSYDDVNEDAEEAVIAIMIIVSKAMGHLDGKTMIKNMQKNTKDI